MEENNEMMTVNGFGSLQNSSSTKMNTLTTIERTAEGIKTLYNLESATIDQKLNDCVGEKMRIKDVVIKRFEKDLDEIEVNEDGEYFVDEAGNPVHKKELKLVTILIDETGTSYVTASKTFAIQMIRFIQQFGESSIKNGLDIEIIKKDVQNSNNKALGFKLV